MDPIGHPTAGQPTRATSPWVDAGLATVLAAVCGALYAATAQTRQYGDGGFLLTGFGLRPDGSADWPHALYFPAAAALSGAWPEASQATVLRALSAAPAALAVGFVYVLARAWGATRGPAMAAALLLAVSPGWWFFATTIELHALHAACVALCALVVLAAPWERPVAAAWIAAVPLPLLFLSHQSGLLLGPGLVLLAQFARRRRGLSALGPAPLMLLVVPLFTATILAAIPTAAALAGDGVDRLMQTSRATVHDHHREFSFAGLVEGWLQPLGLLLPVALVGLVRMRQRGWALAALLGLLVPSLVFFVAWGLPERGGYALPSAMFLAVLAALGLASFPRAAPAAGVLVVAQAALAWSALAAWDTPDWDERMRSRAAAVERLMPQRRGVLITFDHTLQSVTAELPGIEEILGHLLVLPALLDGTSPEVFAETLGRGLIRQCEASRDPLVLDLSHRTHALERDPRSRPYLDALEDWMRAHCTVVRQEDPRWDLFSIAGCR